MSETVNNELQVYSEFALRNEAAFAAFTSIYESKNPRPLKAQVQRDLVSLMIIVALTVVMVAAVIVSSSRTIDEFGGGVIGVNAFIMIEGGIMVYALFRARRTASKERLQTTVKWATIGLVLTFVIGVGANIDAALSHKGIELPDVVNVSINILVAISAPTLAFISSDVLAIELMATDIKRREAEAVYLQECKDWRDGLNRSWASQQKNWGVRIEVERTDSGRTYQPQLSAADGQRTDSGHGYGQGYSKKADARKLVMDYLELNPDDKGLSVRELAEKIGVGKTTVSDVLKAYKMQGIEQ